jgi:hypothetical protein
MRSTAELLGEGDEGFVMALVDRAAGDPGAPFETGCVDR